ncbi:YopR Core [Shewanella psychrophila]|uniref:YopR Core n=1 Tax=Shewanella psychrophila TaxID=225848 RepID=A0A1S6HYH4_9GAMM|nr:YopR/YscH family type III secretion effector [Shewanella psychrophila]AQS40610.1 YopR Core [Shewanella psychrophila]
MIELNTDLSQVQHTADVSTRAVNRDDQFRLEQALSEPAKVQVKKTAKAADVKGGANPEIDAFYKEISALDNPSGTQISGALHQAFGDDKAMADKALWSALNRAKSGSQTGLSERLQELVSVDFISRLQASPPTSSEELKAELKSEFRLSARRETALWEAWAQLKGDPENAALVDLIRGELGHLIQFNSMLRNMMTNTVRPDIF